MKKRIIPIIALSLIGILAITTIIFAVCTKSYVPNFKDFDSVSIGGKNVSSGIVYYSNTENEEAFNKLNELLKNSFNESALNSLFNGRLGYNPEIVKNTNTISNINDLEKYIVYEYENKTELPTITYNEKEISYDRVLIKVEELENTQINLVKVYLLEEEANACSYYFETYANFYHVFDYVKELLGEKTTEDNE